MGDFPAQRHKIPGAVREATAQGYYSSFVPATATQGRPSGGLAILCKDGQPQQRFEKGEHWQLGRWSHHLLPGNLPHTGGVHVYKIWVVIVLMTPLALEKNRALCIEVLGSVSSLGQRTCQMIRLGLSWVPFTWSDADDKVKWETALMWQPTRVPVNMCPLSLPKHWSNVCQAVRNLEFWLLVGPHLHLRPEQWPTVRLPAPAPEPEIVETARSAALPAPPFAIGPHQRVVEHETYGICFDCERHVGVHTGRKCFNYHAFKPLLRGKKGLNWLLESNRKTLLLLHKRRHQWRLRAGIG
eukprot:2557455-Amphidinium_carterae.1